MLKKLYTFLGVDENFIPNLSPKNVTGEVKSSFVQSKMVSHNKYRKWLVDNLVDPIFPVTKRKLLKKKIFEFNTQKNKKPITEIVENNEVIENIKLKLAHYFIEDAAKLDALLGKSFSSSWFLSGVKIWLNNKRNWPTLSHCQCLYSNPLN